KRDREGDFCLSPDDRRSLEIPCTDGHAPGTFPNRVPLRERAAPRADEPYRPRRSAERPRRNENRLPLLFRRIRAECRPLDARVHAPHRPVPQVDRVSVTPQERPPHLESHLRHGLTTPRPSLPFSTDEGYSRSAPRVGQNRTGGG